MRTVNMQMLSKGIWFSRNESNAHCFFTYRVGVTSLSYLFIMQMITSNGRIAKHARSVCSAPGLDDGGLDGAKTAWGCVCTHHIDMHVKLTIASLAASMREGVADWVISITMYHVRVFYLSASVWVCAAMYYVTHITSHVAQYQLSLQMNILWVYCKTFWWIELRSKYNKSNLLNTCLDLIMRYDWKLWNNWQWNVFSDPEFVHFWSGSFHLMWDITLHL